MLVFANEVASIFKERLGYQRFVMNPGPYSVASLRMALQSAHSPTWWANTTHTLLDLRRAPFIPQADQRWLVTMLRRYQLPLQLPERVAHLLAPDVFARLSHSLVLTDALHAAVTYKAFDDESKALNWLLR
jgi:hypothetical protein